MIFGMTHQGLKRESNEDRFFVKEYDKGSFDVVEGDLILLSTDGLHGEVPQERIVSILRSGSSLKATIEDLVQAALDAGGRDNITVVGAQV